MQLILPGEIQLSTAEIVEVDRASKLGEHLQEKVGDNLRYRIRVDVDRGEVSSYSLGLSGEYGSWLDELAEKYREMLCASRVDFDRIEHWLIPGINGSNIPWHTDTPGDMRFMLNIGQTATSVDVGTKWNPNDYPPGDTFGTAPEAHEALSIEVAQMYASNTLATNTDVLRPHQTPVDMGRLMLRTSVYAATHWEDLAVGNGVAVRLQYP